MKDHMYENLRKIIEMIGKTGWRQERQFLKGYVSIDI